MRGPGVHVSIVPFTRVQLSPTRADLYARLRLPSAEAVGSGSGPFWLYRFLGPRFARARGTAGTTTRNRTARSEETKPRIIYMIYEGTKRQTLRYTHNTFTIHPFTNDNATKTTPPFMHHLSHICRTFVDSWEAAHAWHAFTEHGRCTLTVHASCPRCV